MTAAKSWAIVLFLWALILFCYATDKLRDTLRKRRAVRTLEHAKFYLHATTCSYSKRPGARQRDYAAISLLTDKIFEVLECSRPRETHASKGRYSWFGE
jgi:hypothetical protein